MPDAAEITTQNHPPPPPSGDPQKAAKYVDQLIAFIEEDKLTIHHTDLGMFDPSPLQDHFRIDLEEYQVEISHSKHPQSGKDSYVMLFTNLKNVADGNCEKIILAYMHLDDSQFMHLRNAYTEQVDRKRKAEEEKRLKDALLPIDQALENISPGRKTFTPASESTINADGLDIISPPSM
ncbi:hypothetical protein HYZ06_01515 [Candidatus Daviesbacteria bacterium]|nr:hypothetical protein [Candidatus Daviesbacteria bacterium]